MTRRVLPPAFALALALGAPVLAGAQEATRSNEIGRPAEKTEEVTIGRYVFAGIGIDEYENTDVWKALDNAVNDVDHVRQTLVEEFAFDSPDEWILRNAEATQVAIRQLIDDLGRNLQPDDNLVFFYAGHGAERPTVFDGEIVARDGYLVPVGVKAALEDAPSQYLEISRLLSDVAALPARHVLVILDSCYSGMALEGEFKTRGEMTQQASDLISRRSRRVLTSAQADQLAADGGADFPENSLFTGWLTEGLRRAAQGTTPGQPTPDADADGMITVTELFSFVSGRVGAASESRQTPDFGAFKFDNRGELVLALETDPYDDAYEAAIAAFDELKDDAFALALDDALAMQADGVRSTYLRYLDTQFDELLERGTEAERLTRSVTVLQELNDLVAAGESVPVPARLLTIELAKATRLCRKAGCDAAVGN